ncbi:hypothetical protein ABT660_004659, partial [Salmonella enterica subsp. enterica serovar Kentucky]|nr:hypothetical protein [Salmonella enterica]ELC9769875.1 hypothetical protein [Salmonella enterica]ELC9793368.1 hypothetical protein [Salmonella enterica]
NAVLTVSPDVTELVADGKTTATINLTLMEGDNTVGGTVWVDVETPEGGAGHMYTILPAEITHFVSGKSSRTFSTTAEGVYKLKFTALTYGGFETKSKTVTIHAKKADVEKGYKVVK